MSNTGESTEKSMGKVLRFINNYPSDWAQKAFADDKHLADHIQSKWEGYAKSKDSSYEAILKIMTSLSTENERKLMEYIDRTFAKGGSTGGGVEYWKKTITDIRGGKIVPVDGTEIAVKYNKKIKWKHIDDKGKVVGYYTDEMLKLDASGIKIKSSGGSMATGGGVGNDIGLVLDELQDKSDLHDINLFAEEKDRDIYVNDWIFEKFMELAKTKTGIIYNREAEDYVAKYLPELNEVQRKNLGTQIYYAQQKNDQQKDRVAQKKLIEDGWKKLDNDVVEVALQKGHLLRVLKSSEGFFGGTSVSEEILKPFKDVAGIYYVMSPRASRKGYAIGAWNNRKWWYKFVDKKTKREIMAKGGIIDSIFSSSDGISWLITG